MKGTLYGVGIGPGDPELLTVKAIRRIESCRVIAVPGLVPEDTVAYKIVIQAVPELAQKTLVGVHMPMTKDPVKLKESHEQGAKQLEQWLEQGEDVAFLTLGDPTVYSTYLYVHRLVGEHGYSTAIISGIPSFCAVAARLNTGLVEKAEHLHVVPSSYGIEEALELSGTKVLMKAGKKMAQVKEVLQRKGASVSMIENCGMDNEKIYLSAGEIPEDAGYYSLILVKEDER